jgi:hypothetical protein
MRDAGWGATRSRRQLADGYEGHRRVIAHTIVVAMLFCFPRTSGAGPSTVVGTWVGEAFNGYQETLSIYDNGAYKSMTVIVDPDVLRSYLAADCRERIQPKRPAELCDAAWVNDELVKLSKLFPQTYIGTYVVRSARITFAHGCAEEADKCAAGSTQDSGVFFVDGNTLTIKLDGFKYKGRVIGRTANRYSRRK